MIELKIILDFLQVVMQCRYQFVL